MLYRIFTEYRNIDRIERLASEVLDGFTLVPATGFWKGTKEDSVIIEYIAPESDTEQAKVRALAKRIKDVNHQEAVLVQQIENKSWLV